MRIAIVIAAFLVFSPRICQAEFADFSEYSESTTFETGEIFHSEDLSFKAIEFLPIENNAWVHVLSYMGVKYQDLHPSPGVEILLPAGVKEVSMFYSDGAGSSIEINGEQPDFPLGVARFFSLVDGTTVGGVSIHTAVSSDHQYSETGILTLQGPISTLKIAGVEISLDDIWVNVPEPSTGVLLLVGLGGLFFRCGGRRGKISKVVAKP